MRVGIFGGTFNPPHLGHLGSIQEVQKKAGLGRVLVIPAAQNPLKKQLEGPTPQQRLEMTKLAVQGWGSQFAVDDQEVLRGKKSYTIDTVMNLRKTQAADDLYLIIGMDKFEELAQWKNPEELLTECNLIITSRPGFDFPSDESDLPKFIQKLVADFDFNFIELKTGRNIQFMRIQDVAISSTELRKQLRMGKNVEKFVPLAVENYIKTQKLYEPVGDKIGDFKKFTEFCAQVLFDKKAIAAKGFDLTKMSGPSSFALVASGTSTRHAADIAENVMQAVKEEFNVYPQSLEGIDEGRWVVVDYGDLILHIFYDFVRQEYQIENLWQQGIDMNLKDAPKANDKLPVK